MYNVQFTMKEMAKQKGSPREAGQTILILILVMTVALSIGLSIVQKSLVDISTASKVEQSSRAFSAAEAGIEKALQSSTDASCTNCQSFTDNNSKITAISDSRLMPAVPDVNSRQAALEYPPLAKEDVAQVWLIDPTSSLPDCDSGKVCYSQTTLDVYWGNSATDKAALELTLVYYDGTVYQSQKWYLDHSSANRSNGFDTVACNGSYSLSGYQCYKQLTSLPAGLMLIRARLLYNSTSQPFAVQAVGTRADTGSCSSGCWLPPRARSIISTGVSGETQRSIKVFQLDKMVPTFFDYAIFSAGDINK